METELRSYGALPLRGGDFDPWDLEVRGGPLGSARMFAAIEYHGDGRQLLRIRSWPRCSAAAVALTLLFAALSTGAAHDRAWNACFALGAVALLIVAGLAFGYGYRQQIAVGHLTAQQTTANSTIDQLQGQLNSVNAKLNDMVAAQQAAAQAAAEKNTNPSPGAKHGAPVADKRYKQLQAQLENQEKQLKETQDQVAKNRTDLETNLNSTKDELSGSIAKLTSSS